MSLLGGWIGWMHGGCEVSPSLVPCLGSSFVRPVLADIRVQAPMPARTLSCRALS